MYLFKIMAVQLYPCDEDSTKVNSDRKAIHGTHLAQEEEQAGEHVHDANWVNGTPDKVSELAQPDRAVDSMGCRAHGV